MSKFDLVKRVDLSEYGEEWKDCYLNFALPTYADIKDLEGKAEVGIESAIERLKVLFKSGKALSEGELVDVTKDDMDELPLELLTKIFKAISGEVSPKVDDSSKTIS